MNEQQRKIIDYVDSRQIDLSKPVEYEMSDELTMMTTCLLRRMKFRDKFGRRLLLTGFKSRSEAVMSVLDEHGSGTGQQVVVSSLEWLEADADE